MWVPSRGAQLRRKVVETCVALSRRIGSDPTSTNAPCLPTFSLSQPSHPEERSDEGIAFQPGQFSQPSSHSISSNHAGGRGIAVRPPDDPLELEPDDDDPDEPDDPDDEPELPVCDDDAPLVVPLEDPDV
jgi:hypothetical protein